jgi:uroporphyrinogen decarboxylase
MVEGGSTKDFRRIKGLVFDDPASAHVLLDVLARSVAQYLNAQIRAGAQAIMVFDTWGGVLGPVEYEAFSLRYMAAIVDSLLREHEGRRVPVILFTKGGGAYLEALAETGCEGLGIDWTTDIGQARGRVGARVALQGNLDPCMLYASPERIREGVANVLAGFGAGSGHVFNLGHGLQPGMEPEHVGACVQAVRDLSPAYHGADAESPEPGS